MTPETSAKISATLSGKPKTNAHKAALRKPKSLTHALSPAHAAALAAGRAAYWTARRDAGNKQSYVKVATTNLRSAADC